MPDVQDHLWAALASRYLRERELGRGGMATVYLAHDRRHDRPVALKVLHPELGLGTGSERFHREIRLAAQLQHPHIVTVLDSGEVAGVFWYAMPYIEGESLRERLRREGRLPIADAVFLAREVADALDCAHRQGVVHRDVKPENILLSRGHALVVDFGVARAIERRGQEALTSAGMVIGTLTYMSPEQADGTPDLDGRSDVYSLGCVLYEMLTGEPPWKGGSPLAVLNRRFTEPPPSPAAVRPDVPPALDAVVRRAMARSADDRFPGAGELALALALGAALTTPQASGAGALGEVPDPSVTVLPVANLSADPENE